ncbi:hypothetical protein H5410_032954 [Solanum commersonii]|uniref:Uncharacterized protein n=1 Tax=Solanum commersonii TaxID=4109 RepID=A0A9J5YPD6_SOLCO|nr:hypothetical protein H5410_032954 [Solanum commersonii]
MRLASWPLATRVTTSASSDIEPGCPGETVGNGGKTLFWEDVWAGQETLKNKYPDLFNLSLQKVSTIREMRDNQGWDLRFRRHLNDWEINRVAELLNTLEQYKDLTPNEDNLFWLPDKQGRFSVGSAYKTSQRSISQSSGVAGPGR